MREACAAVLFAFPLDAAVIQPVAFMQVSGPPEGYRSCNPTSAACRSSRQGHRSRLRGRTVGRARTQHPKLPVRLHRYLHRWGAVIDSHLLPGPIGNAGALLPRHPHFAPDRDLFLKLDR